MFIHNAVRAVTAVVAAGAGLALGVAAALASEPRDESGGRSGLWPPVHPLDPAMVPQDGVTDWVVPAALVLATTATLAFHRRDHVHHV